MIDRSGEITPNMRVSKLAQYDRLTEKTQRLAERFRGGDTTFDEKGKRVINLDFVDAGGEQASLQITPRFLWGMHRIRDRAFNNYRLVNENQTR